LIEFKFNIMKEKKLIIKFTKGVTYAVPAKIVAEDRARYYANVDGYEEDSQEFLNEVNTALDDEFMIFDWVQNDMNWSDLRPYAERIEEKPINLDDEWSDGNHTISTNW
jgi:hypothetical protein